MNTPRDAIRAELQLSDNADFLPRASPLFERLANGTLNDSIAIHKSCVDVSISSLQSSDNSRCYHLWWCWLWLKGAEADGGEVEVAQDFGEAAGFDAADVCGCTCWRSE